MITPVEVLGKELRRGFGYKAVEVEMCIRDRLSSLMSASIAIGMVLNIYLQRKRH